MSFFSFSSNFGGEKKKRGKQPDRRPLCYPLTICWLPAKNLHHSTRNRPWKRELLCCRYFSKHFLSSWTVAVSRSLRYIFKFFSILSEWQQQSPTASAFRVCESGGAQTPIGDQLSRRCAALFIYIFFRLLYFFLYFYNGHTHTVWSDNPFIGTKKLDFCCCMQSSDFYWMFFDFIYFLNNNIPHFFFRKELCQLNAIYSCWSRHLAVKILTDTATPSSGR